MCDLCEKSKGTYDVNRICCCLRLILSTPPHGARAAMWAHLEASMDDEAFLRLRDVWSFRGPQASTDTGGQS